MATKAQARRSRKPRQSQKSEVHLSVQTPWPDEAPTRRSHASLTRPPGYMPLVQGAIACEPRRLKDVDDARRRYESDGDRDRLADAIYEATVETSTVNGGGWFDDGLDRRAVEAPPPSERWVGPLSCLDGREAVDDSVNGRGGVQVFGGLDDNETPGGSRPNSPGFFSFVSKGT